LRLGARGRARAGRHRQDQPRDERDNDEGGQADVLPTQRRRRFHRCSPPNGLPEKFGRRFLQLAKALVLQGQCPRNERRPHMAGASLRRFGYWLTAGRPAG
jgi:hypothetical protein